MSVNGIASFALRITWDPPVDNGGREILDYVISLEDSTYTVPAATERVLLIRDGVLMPNATY